MKAQSIRIGEIGETPAVMINASLSKSIRHMSLPTFAAMGYAFRNPDLLGITRYLGRRAEFEKGDSQGERSVPRRQGAPWNRNHPGPSNVFFCNGDGISPAIRAKIEAATVGELSQLEDELLQSIDRYNALTNDGKTLGAGQRADLAENQNMLDAVREEVRARAWRASGGGRPRTVQDTPHDGTRINASSVRSSAPASDRQNWGFKDRAEYLLAVRNASTQGGSIDPRLIANAPTTYGQEGVGADGGFAVPPDFRAEIIRKVLGEDSLLARTDQQLSSSNTFVVPADETTPWQASGGIQAYWESEGGQKQQSKPDLKEKSVKLNKLIALVPVTDELLEDAPSLANYVSTKAPEKMIFRVNDAIINGTGAGQPKGILTSPGTVIVNPESGQAADTIRFENIVKLWNRVTPSARRNAVWLMNPDVEAQLLTMQFPGTGTAVPAYMPPGGLSAAPYGTLLGRPIMPTEAAPALGDKGDIIFGDLRAYLSITKIGGIRSDISIHVWFDYDITAFRFVLRVGGQPWWDSAIAGYHAGTASRGFFATLAART